MPGKDAITKNIIKTVAIFLFFQSLLFLILVTAYGIYSMLSILLYGIAVVFHILLALFLIRMKKYFLLLESHKELSSINLANLLTIARLSLLPVICYLIILTKDYPVVPVLLVVTVVAFLTDFLDGAVSRLTHQITEIGKYLDSISDYSVLFVISIAFFIFDLLPDWFFILIMVRLVSQAISVTVLFLGFGRRATATPWGKAAVFSTMALYAFELLRLLDVPYLGNGDFLRILEWIVGGILVVSFFDKMVFLITNLREHRREKSDRPAQDT